MINDAKIINLINKIKEHSANWMNMNFIKYYLRKNDTSLRDIPILHNYLMYLQTKNFIFDCEHTYILSDEKCIYVFAKSKNNFDFRTDKINLSENNASWKYIDASNDVLLRLKNAISITNSDSEEECKSMVSHLRELKV